MALCIRVSKFRKESMRRDSLQQKYSILGVPLVSQPTGPCPGRRLRGPECEPLVQRDLVMVAPPTGQPPTGPSLIHHRWRPSAQELGMNRQSRSWCGRSNPWPPRCQRPLCRHTQEGPIAGWPSPSTKCCTGRFIQYTILHTQHRPTTHMLGICTLYLRPGFVPRFHHADSHLSYRLALLRVPIIYQSHSLTLLRPISSSSAGLYFLSSIIISPVSLLACVLEPLNFYPTHPSWPPTLEPSINS